MTNGDLIQNQSREESPAAARDIKKLTRHRAGFFITQSAFESSSLLAK